MLKLIPIIWILCFIKNGCTSKNGLIVNGVEVKPQKFTHSVYLVMVCNKIFYSCGGSIINQRLVLTAGHCLQGCKTTEIAIRVGNIKTYLADIISCQKYSVHSRYKGHLSSVDVGYDVAIALAGADFKFGLDLKRVALMEQPPKAEYGYVAGWGSKREGKKEAETHLQYAKQKILDEATCLKMLEYKFNGTICAKSIENAKLKGYPAVGDSGSALVVKGYIQIGIVSYREPLNDKSLTVYSYIPFFLNWIENTSEKLYCEF